jgi:sulfhydrogenase subunit beta (sulfur reductase)
MSNIYKINRDEWYRLILTLSVSSYKIFAPVRKTGGIDYSLIDKENRDEIVYNEAKPATPLKMFFLPVKLNVTRNSEVQKKTIIIGAPACDIEGLKLLDLMYLDEKFIDDTYLSRRDNTVLISTDCYITQEHCHCSTYGINPYPSNGCDISLSSDINDHYLMTWSEKGERFIKDIDSSVKIDLIDKKSIEAISEQRKLTIRNLSEKNEKMPATEETGIKIKSSSEDIWKKYSSKCVSCGACSSICPTCTCFLLIDKPGFEKVKQLDTCQYPAFERVAGGEDPLKELHIRFKNRYMCKYIWKPEKFNAIACTGCGRCIESCIAKINKNELIQEFMQNSN